ncbi:MAG: PAS domain-containing protein [Pirellulales bacterium]|nr:PAS domain-containing protein [Pirellulales bacterium]
MQDQTKSNDDLVREIESLRRQVEDLRRTEIDRGDADRALHESGTTLRSLIDNLPDFMLIVDREARIQFANRGNGDVSPEELCNTIGFTHIAPESLPACRHALEQAFTTQEVQVVEALTVFGHWWNCRLIPLMQDGPPTTVMIICIDITQRKAAEESLRREQKVLRGLIDLQERERRFFAYEIHDGLAQQLAGAQMRFQSLVQLGADMPPEGQRTFDEAMSLLSEGIGEARRLISGLRPPILDESGIVAAVDFLIHEAQSRERSEIEFFHHVRTERLPALLETAVFRIVQESLANACRHARSDRIRVGLKTDKDQIHVDIHDWGVGFDPNAVPIDRFGLRGIRERVRLLGGVFSLDTAPGRGTHLSVDLPLDDDDS